MKITSVSLKATILKYVRALICSAVLLIFAVCLGCNNEAENKDHIAYISAIQDSPYTKTFNDLQLGVVSEFHLRLPQADTSWVTLWVEGYKNGDPTVPAQLAGLSTGLHPDKTSEDSLGFAIIHPRSEETASLLLYASGASTSLHPPENILNSEGIGIRTWDFAINEEIGLEPGETKVLGAYREAQNSIKPYDYKDITQIRQMIDEDMTVLLLKIKVERRN